MSGFGDGPLPPDFLQQIQNNAGNISDILRRAQEAQGQSNDMKDTAADEDNDSDASDDEAGASDDTPLPDEVGPTQGGLRRGTGARATRGGGARRLGRGRGGGFGAPLGGGDGGVSIMPIPGPGVGGPIDDDPPSSGSDDSNLVDNDVAQIDVEEEKKKDANLNEFDFRFGGIPEGISYVGEAPVLEKQKDESSILVLPRGTYLKVELKDLKPNGGERINDFTLTMDIKIDGIPEDGLSLFQTSFPETSHTDEAYLYPTGGVGIFSEAGEPLIQLGKWNRIVVTMGGAWGATRRMHTYVNGKKCAEINKGIFGTPDKRFSINPKGLLVFASQKDVHMPGVSVRYISLRTETRSAATVKKETHANSVFSQWKIEQVKAKSQMHKQLSLQSLYQRPPPMWNDRAYYAHFGDAFIENTGLEGGSIYNSVRVLSLVYNQMLSEQRAWLNDFDDGDYKKCERVRETFENAIPMFRKFMLGIRSGAQLVAFLRRFRKLLEGLKPGDFMLVPGGWNHPQRGVHWIMFVLERQESTFRLTVCNTGEGNEYHPVTAEYHPKIKYKNSIAIDDIAPERILDDAWWAMVFKVIAYPSKLNGAERIYDYLLPFLTKKPLEASIFETDFDGCMEWRSPQLANTDYYRCALEAFHYMHARLTLDPNKLKTVHINMRRQMLKMVVHDLHIVWSLTESDQRLIRIGCEQLAYHSVKHAKRGHMTALQLSEVKKTIDGVETRIKALPCDDENSTAPPPQLDLDFKKDADTQWWLQKYFDRLQRKEDTDGLAGPPIVLPKFVPINMLLIPARSTNFEEALAAIRYCDKLCTSISVQSHTVKNGGLLKVALIQHTFTQVVPVPVGCKSPRYKECMWAQPMRYALQLDVLLLLQRIMEHFASSAFSLRATRSFDAVRIIVPGCMAAIGDAMLRKEATDIPSEVSQHLIGFGDNGAFGISCGGFGEQSETIEVALPELNVARTSVLDYFRDLEIDPERQMFQWEKSQQAEPSSATFCANIAVSLAFDPSDPQCYVSGEQYLIHKNYPEFVYYRDIVFYWKFFMATDKKAFPPVHEWTQKHAELKWKFEEGQYLVTAYGRMPLFCKADGHRWPSAATPSKYTFPNKVLTEDDVLHVRNLPNFDDVMGARDAELLISYLTVPYIRLPLILGFFATEDRIHTLKSKDLQAVLDSVMFEPGRYLEAYMDIEPKFVPTKDPKLLATPYGLLLNELHRSPDGIIQSILDLLRFALNLDTGTVHASGVDIILFVVRSGARFDNAMSFLVDHAEGNHQCISAALRDVTVTPRVLGVLKEGLVNLRKLLRESVHRMLEAWCAQALKECNDMLDNEKVVDTNTRIACNLHAHLFLIYRNVRFEDMTPKIMSTFLTSFVFLTTRHTWNMRALEIPETEIFEAFQVQRRTVVRWLNAQPRSSLSKLMEAVVRVTAGTGSRVASSTDLIRGWAYIEGGRSIGRYTVAESASLAAQNTKPDDVVDSVPDHEHGIEINLQTAQLTLKTSHLKALDRKIAQRPDCVEVFGSQSMQCAVIESAKNRELVRLIGRHHDVAHWHTPDERMALQVNDRDYEPGFLPSSEQWIVPLFEPVRLSFFTQPVEIQFCLPEEVLSPSANVAYLVAIHPEAGGTWKEVFVFKDQRMVQIYSVLSHGRRFYRTLDFSTDARFSLREMQPPTGDRRGPWPKWGRHMAGSPVKPSHQDPTSVVITRQKVLPANLSGTDEMFIPSRLLYGLVPSAILDTHRFWQDDDDNIRGYPLDTSVDELIYVELQDVDHMLHSSFPGVAARVFRRKKKVDELRSVAMREAEEKSDKPSEPPADFDPKKDELLLLDLLYAPAGTPLYSLGRLLSRVENLSYVLAWTKQSNANKSGDPYHVDIVELPRLKLTFTATTGADGVTRLFSVDHANLFVTNKRTALTTSLIRGIPHSLILANANQEPFILVPSIHPVRPFIMSAPFSTELVMNRANVKWYATLDTRYYLYPVHISLSFMFTPTLASALYLLLLRFQYRDYADVFRLVNSIATDTDFSEEEQIIFQTLGAQNGDAHPNAHACRAKISLLTIDSPVVCPWDLPEQLSKYVSKIAHVSSVCRLSDVESLQLLEVCEDLFKKEQVVRTACQAMEPEKLEKIMKSILDPVASAEITLADKKAQDDFFQGITDMIEKELGTAATREEILAIVIRVIRGQSLSDFLRALLKNRRSFLESKTNMHDTAQCFVPPRASHSNWVLYRDRSVLAAEQKDWGVLSLAHQAPKAISGHMILDLAHQLWSGKEDLTGSAFKLGFLFLYELFTGTIKCKIGGNDDAHSFAHLMTYLYRDASDPGLMPSILMVLANNPELCKIVPKLHDTRKWKVEKFNAWRDDKEPESPLDDLLSTLVPLIISQSDSIVWRDGPSDFAHMVPSRTQMDIPKDILEQYRAEVKQAEVVENRDGLIPTISDFSCEERFVTPLTANQNQDHLLPLLAEGSYGYDTVREKLAEKLALPLPKIEDFCALPLAPCKVEEFVVKMTRDELGLKPVDGLLPFDVTAHPQAQSKVAKDMVSRLKADAKLHAEMTNAANAPRLIGLLDADSGAFSRGESMDKLETLMERMNELLSRLGKLRDEDTAYVTSSIPVIVDAANHVDLPDVDSDNQADAKKKLSFLLLRYSGQETTLWLDYLIGTLLSSKARFDWKKLNPYSRHDTQEHVSTLIVAALFHANRAGVANRAMDDVRNVIKLLEQAQASANAMDTATADANGGGASPTTLNDADRENLRAGLIQRGESLARNLVAERFFVEKDKKNAYDPRFLVFEFTWNIMLRQQQVLLVREFMDSIRSGKSLVKQMIMGAGKTTVVAPLLALMLADGKSLVCQVVPRALLEFSRSVMRSTFSSVMHKRIYTFTFDRATRIDQNLHKKLANAMTSSGIVISTPTAVKSLMLKFLEMLDFIDDPTRPRHKDMEKEASMLGEVLRLFQEGVLLMDEVDLILHPLKSELNFPIGEKHDLDFHPLRWKLPIHILDCIFYAERSRMSVGFRESTRASDILERLRVVIDAGYESRALQRSPHIVLLDPEFYHKRMKPVVAEWVHLWLESQHVSEIAEDKIMTYIIQGAENGSDLAEEVERKVSPKHKKMLNLSRDWLRSFLPHVLQKIDRVSFGILSKSDLQNAMRMDPHMPRTRAKLGVPFVGKDVPSRSSEFAHPDIIIGLTILAYRYEGLRYSDFNDIVASLRATLIKEMGPYAERASSRRHASWVVEAGGKIRGVPHYHSQEEEEESTSAKKLLEASDAKQSALNKSSSDVVTMEDGQGAEEAEEDDEFAEVVPLRLLKRSNDEQMNKLYQLIRFLPDTIHWYLNDFIFPAYMRHQQIKLSACGQEVGGDMLFAKRLGFSGTPSDLLPEELGRCGYEKGTDGLMIATLTDPKVMDYSILELNWSVKSILNRIATVDPPFHALIDTGALITGMSNLQVARYLLDHGLEGFEGVVFLDDLDRKMILVRATGRVLKLAQCGIELPKRFAFYDQVHTTGMDIKHVSNATAVLTMGKDMTFRDYSQGAFRMRGIAKGQRIHLYIIPEVDELIQRELKLANLPSVTGNEDLVKFLEQVSAWQVINSMRLERIQFNQLCLQNVENVYRKNAFNALLNGYHSFRLSDAAPGDLRKALAVFRQSIDFSLEAAVPVPRLFSETISNLVKTNKAFIYDAVQQAVVDKVLSIIDGLFMGEEEEYAYTAEMVQQQEEEKEKQQEQEQEQEIEIEKYVDLAYSREHEEPTPWRFDSLKEEKLQDQFYNANEFKLYKREPITFPEYLKVSNNYFDKRWSGARRLKNVIMVLEHVPNLKKLAPLSQQLVIAALERADSEQSLLGGGGVDADNDSAMPSQEQLELTRTLTTTTESAIHTAFELFDCSNSGDINADEMRKVIRSAMDFNASDDEIREIMKTFAGPDKLVRFPQLRELLYSDKFRVEEAGRKYVVVSLAEAETIRRIMHIRLERDVIDNADTAIALRCIPANNRVMDVSHRFKEAHQYQSETAYQSSRYLDCDMYFKPPQLNVLLRSLQMSAPRKRQIFFELTIGCRRRMRRKWEETPLAKVFSLRTEFHLLKQRAQAVRTREAIQEKGLLFYDAFRMFDADRNGLLSPAELYGALDWLNVKITPMDILEFVASADSDGDGNLNYKDFVDMLRDPDQKVEDMEEAPQEGMGGAPLLKPQEMEKIQPKGEQELKDLQEKINRAAKLEEEKLAAREASEEKRIQAQIEEEEAEKDRLLGIAPNPTLEYGQIRYDFTTGRLPKRMSARGHIEYRQLDLEKKYLRIEKQSFLELELPFEKNGAGNNLNEYTVTLEMQIEKRPTTWQSVFQCTKPKRFAHEQGEISIQHDGGVGAHGTFGQNASSKMKPNQWHLVCVAVNLTRQEITTYVDGTLLSTVKGADVSPDSGFSIDTAKGVSIFGSSKTSEMAGGNLKFVLVHSRVLTPEEITSLYAAHAAEGSWACEVCTVRNDASAARCSVCSTPKPSLAAGAAAGGGWSCPMCTFLNKHGASNCEVCDGARP